MSIVVAGVVGVVGLAVVFMLATAHGRETAGRLSRETARADRSAIVVTPADALGRPGETGPEADPLVRARGAAARLEGDSSRAERAVITRSKGVGEDELGVTRREFFNRGILAGLALAVGAFGAASLAFLWPTGGGGFGGKTNVGGLADVQKAIAGKQPYYSASAKTYIQPYPPSALAKAAKVYPAIILAGMKLGYVALYQKCPHLGCRVPWCFTSQWFECPCHGSKYNRVGEKKGGPAPRGMDRFPFTISDGNVIVDTDTVVQGPPIGTDTTGQGQEGAACV
jgi:cytochrome b6-f complex iron-sulfur subunit